MLYKYKQLLESFSNSQDLKYIYHYIWKEDHIKNIIKTKKLISINKLGNDHEGTAKYKNRDGTTHPPEYYYELSYNKLYKDLIGKPYTTHGLYFTTTDFFGFESKIVGRVKVPIETIFKNGPVTFSHGRQFGSKISLVKTKEEIQKEHNKYPTDSKSLKTLYRDKNKVYLFENLPQIVIWADTIPITKDMIEIR